MIRWLFLLIAMILVAQAPAAYAAETIPGETCSSDPQFDPPTNLLSPGSGLISTVITDIQATLENASRTLFNNIAESTFMSTVMPALLTLYIIVYGVLFLFGMIQITIFDFLVRIVKIGIIAGFADWSWYTYVYGLTNTFFGTGTDVIIAKLTAIMTGISTIDPNYPFDVMDAAVIKIISPRMAVTLLAILFTGPYGLIFGLLLALSLWSFLKALFTALWVYLMALILRSLLLAVMPIFLVCLLFERTRHLFTGWLGQMLNVCLQPIFLFVFFAFFASLITVSASDLLTTPVCKVMVPELWHGGPTNLEMWRFTVWDGNKWSLFSGTWNFAGAEGIGGQPFPIDILHILILYMLAELAGRFNSVVLMIAKDLSGASTDLTGMQSPLSEWFSPSSGGSQSPISKARTGPGAAKPPQTIQDRTPGLIKSANDFANATQNFFGKIRK